jgi:flavin reductase (DIM6/NTAB) family NADH-FMN oxidoreductase RutF
MNIMKEKFKEIDVKGLNENVFKILDDEWALITAGEKDSFNTMTVSWGSFGILWNKPVAIIYIRPHRHTLKFIEEATSFTISFFNEEYKHVLNYCGQNSGNKVDKIKETGLIPIYTKNGGISFEQSRLVIDCHKIYSDVFKPENFHNKELIHRLYPGKDYHHIYIGEIINCYIPK